MKRLFICGLLVAACGLIGCATPKHEKQTKWTRAVKPKWVRVHGSYVACPRCATENIYRTGETQKGVAVYRCGECQFKFREWARGDEQDRAINPIQCPQCGGANVLERRGSFRCDCGHRWQNPNP